MDTNPSMPPVNSPEPVASASTLDTSTHKIFGVPRRVIGFGFILFVMLLVLAVLYSQFTKDKMPTDTTTQMMPKAGAPVSGKPMPAVQSVTGPVTPDTVVNDLIDEALADREDTDSYTQDEVADVEEGSNY